VSGKTIPEGTLDARPTGSTLAARH
jgi:hypothetical protein